MLAAIIRALSPIRYLTPCSPSQGGTVWSKLEVFALGRGDGALALAMGSVARGRFEWKGAAVGRNIWGVKKGQCLPRNMLRLGVMAVLGRLNYRLSS